MSKFPDDPRHIVLAGTEALADVGIKEHPGYVGAFTTRTAPGYLPRGTRIRKNAADPDGDLTPLGTLGTVLGSIHHPELGGGYFVEWDNCPKRAVFMAAFKVLRV